MLRAQKRKMILEIIERVDYDIWKRYIPKLSELSPQDINENLYQLEEVVDRYLKEKP